MKKLKILLIFIAVIVVALLVGKFFTGRAVQTTLTSPTPTINITHQNIASVLSKNTMIGAIPSDASIALKIGEKNYILEKGIVKEGNADSEITITLPEKYLEGLTNKNFCSVIQKANKNRDLGFETSLSKTSLAWKFKGMYKYRDCLGL